MLKKALGYFLPFCVGLAATMGAQAVNADLAAKEMLSYTCVGCHGPNGNSAGPATPSLGGQNKHYLITVMLGYKYYDQPDELDNLMDQKEFEDFELHPRYSIIMSRLMTGYSVEEIKLIAEYFAEQEWQNAEQQTDSALSASGDKLHESSCEKCHEEGGTSDIDDISIVAGQWMPYLQDTLDDYIAGRSEMPKKMKQKLEAAHEKYGDEALEKLVHFYGDQ